MRIIDQLGILAISTRLQRLSETLRKEGALIYNHYGIDFEPKWFPIIYTLHHRDKLSVVEIANEIGYTHPSTISLLKELEKQKLTASRKDKVDDRKRLIVLTAKGKSLIVKMQPVWEIMTAALNEIVDNKHHLLKAIDEIEQKLAQQGFLQKVLQMEIKENKLGLDGK